MKKIILSILAIACVGLVESVRADDSRPRTLTPAERNSALFGSGAAIRISPVYVDGGVTYYHRRVRHYRTVRVVYWAHGVRYVRYERRPVYHYW
jgi:hypothetical protein